MAANQFGIDIGAALTQAEQIKKARADRQLSERKNALAQKRADYAANPQDESLRSQLLIEDPEGMKATAEAIGKMDENDLKRTELASLNLARYAKTAIDSPDPAATWAQIRDSAPAEIQAKMGEYSPIKAKQMFYNSMTISELVKNPDVVRAGGYDQVYQHGEAIGKKTPSENMLKMNNDNQQRELDRQNTRGNALIRSNGGGSSARPKDNAAFSAQAYRMAKDLVGGIYTVDEDTGEKRIDKGRADQASWIQTRALHNMSNNGGSLAQNIRQAHQEMNATLDRERGSSRKKPAGARRPSAKSVFGK